MYARRLDMLCFVDRRGIFDLELSVNKVGGENVSSGSERTNEDDL